MKQFLTNLFAKLAMVAVLATAFAGSAWAETVTLVSGSGTSDYAVPSGWTSSGTVEGGSYLKFDNGTITSPEFAPHNGLSFAYSVATFGSGTNHPLTIRILNASTNAVIVEKTTATPTSSSYISTNSPLSLGDISVKFKIQLYAPTGKGIRLRNYSITGTPASSSSAVATTTTISASGITNTDVYVNTAAGSLSATVKDANNNTVSGASVTWSGNNDAVATINSTGAVTLVGKGTVKFTASYAGVSGVYEASSADYNMTVTSSAPYVQPTEFDINLNNTLFGVATGNNAAEQSSTIENVVVIAGCKSSATSKTYYDSGHVRFYADSYLKFTAPSGYNITNVLFTAGGTWSGSISVNAGTYDNETKTWTGETEQLNFEFAAQNRISSVAINLKKQSSIATPTFSPQEGTYTGAQNVTITCETSGVDIYYTTDGTTPSATNGTLGTSVTISETSTLKAIAIKGDESSSVASATYTIVTFDHAGTQADPYSVADAIKAVDNGVGVENVYATGIVCTASSQLYKSKYLSYYISDDGNSSSSKLEAYNGLGIDGAAFTSKDDVKVGDIVVIKGYLTKHNSTYEFAADNQLVSLDRPVHPIINASNVTIEHDATSGEIAYTVDNPSTGVTLGATTTADWISNIEVTADKVTFTTTPNDGDADRTATITLTYTGATDKTVTVTQKHFVIDFATLPFEWAGGTSANLLKENGVSVSGNGSDYGDNNSPYYVKLDGTGDYIQVKTDGRPGMVTVGVKMIGGASTSKITVQGSADGVTFTDVEELTISGEQNDVLTLETSNDFASTDRYVRLYFTKGSNVGVGPISISKFSSEPSITLSSYSVAAPVEETQGTLNVTYKYIETSVGVEIHWFESDGTTTADEPEWISTDINSSYNVDYVIEANTGAARTAYFKVYGIDAETNGVYSELVTVSQAEFVPNYAELDFEYDGNGQGTLPAGLSQEGLTDNYSSSPKIKFDTTGDWLLLQFNEVPGKLTFDIKGNGFSGGTFKVQTSTDGVSYTDLETYTTLSDTQNEEFNLLPSVRFIKWVYIEKVNGNVGLGNIKLTALAAGADSYTLEGKLSGGLYWASFYCNSAGYTLSDGAKAFTLNSNKQLYQLGDGNVIPANTAVVIISDTDLITLKKSTSASASVSGGGNILVGSDSDIAVSSGTPYVLGNVGDALGFYKYTGDKVPAMKAYYIVNQ